MLATSVPVLPHGADWTFEFKWDGIRALLESSPESSGRGVRLWSRRGNEVTIAYPELTGPGVSAAFGDVLVDGEIVAFVDSVPSFEALQSRMHVRDRGEAGRLAEHIPVTFIAFDLLRLDGTDLTGRPLSERRAALARWAEGRPVNLSPFFDDGEATAQIAKQHRLEGVVAKRASSRYRPGARSRDWQKFRFTNTGDFAVIGWEAPADAPNTLSSLVLGVQTDAGLVFAGKAGSGLTGATAAALQRRLTARPDSPVGPVPPPSPGRVTHWVEPDVVVEIEFAIRTNDGRLRHPVFRRLRTDKIVEEATG